MRKKKKKNININIHVFNRLKILTVETAAYFMNYTVTNYSSHARRST